MSPIFDIKALYEYDAFGNIITKCGSLANDFLFSTQIANTSSGWYMYMFRSYNPSLGRWTQRDPLDINETGNLYGFVKNDPINLYDILGLHEKTGWQKVKEFIKWTAVYTAVKYTGYWGAAATWILFEVDWRGGGEGITNPRRSGDYYNIEEWPEKLRNKGPHREAHYVQPYPGSPTIVLPSCAVGVGLDESEAILKRELIYR